MGLLFIIMGVLGVAGFIFHLIDVIQEKRETEPEATIIRVSNKRPVFWWYQVYTFSLHGQHFQIKASNLSDAWNKARRLGVSGLYLISESKQQCEVKYECK